MRRKQNNVKQDILFVLGSSLIVVIAWIGFNLYHIWVTSTIDEKVQAQLTPIDGTFDTSIIQELKSRKQVVPLFTKEATASSEATITPSPTVIPTVATPLSVSPISSTSQSAQVRIQPIIQGQ